MKKTVIAVSMALSLLIAVLPALAAEESVGGTVQQSQQKDECMLLAMNCGDEVLSIQQRIDRLEGEIAKGSDVYSTEELQVLRKKLDAAYEEFNRSNMNKAY